MWDHENLTFSFTQSWDPVLGFFLLLLLMMQHVDK